MSNIHEIQVHILQRLSTTSYLRFNQLVMTDVASEHMNYHLKKLILLGYVIKSDDHYTLSDSGKDYVNLLDDETRIVERQPKIAVIIHGVRLNEQTHEVEFLLNKRLEQPYLGKVGRVGGKVRFGETLEQAAQRELYEETHLTAQCFVLEQLYRKMRKREDGLFVQDVLFFIFFVTDFSGELLEKTAYQENFWISKKALLGRKDLDPYDDLILEERLSPLPFGVEERVGIAEGY
ncbi:NUDIX domain-containing protein [candidate division WWE3 bacterium]|nr:NUDIX domain-containing protein [candidate division WWE3 bacterium]